MGQGVDELFAQTVAEVLVLLVRAHVRERQHRQRSHARRRRDAGSRGHASGLAFAFQPRQVDQKILGRLIADFAVLLERLVDDSLQLAWYVRIEPHGGGRRLMEDSVENRHRRVPPEGQVAGHHLVEYHPQREKVRPRVELLPERLFRRHVRHRPGRRSGAGQRFGGGQGFDSGIPFRRELGQPEIEDLSLPPSGDEDVGRLDVPVDDPSSVRGFKTVGHFERHRQDLAQPPPLRKDGLSQGLALEQFHGDEGLPLILVDVIDGTDIRVVQGRGRLGLPLEALQRAAVPRQRFGQKFQGHGALEPGVLGLVNHSHAAAAELPDYLVAAGECRTDGELLDRGFRGFGRH